MNVCVCLCVCVCVCESLWESHSLHVQPTHQPKSSHTVHTVLLVNQLPTHRLAWSHTGPVSVRRPPVPPPDATASLCLRTLPTHQLSVMRQEKNVNWRTFTCGPDPSEQINFLANLIKSQAPGFGFRESPKKKKTWWLIWVEGRSSGGWGWGWGGVREMIWRTFSDRNCGNLSHFSFWNRLGKCPYFYILPLRFLTR